MNETDLLERQRPWLLTVAWNMCETGHDDLAQEGWIALWIEHRKSGISDDAWLHTVAKNRMRNVLRDAAAAKRGGLRDDQELTDIYNFVHEGLELAYHHGQLAVALETLTDRERDYVYLRFWRDKSYRYLNEHFGTTNVNVQIWRKARVKLEVALENLRSCHD